MTTVFDKAIALKSVLQRCVFCGQELLAVELQCDRCHEARYCSLGCMKNDIAHRNVCNAAMLAKNVGAAERKTASSAGYLHEGTTVGTDSESARNPSANVAASMDTSATQDSQPSNIPDTPREGRAEERSHSTKHREDRSQSPEWVVAKYRTRNQGANEDALPSVVADVKIVFPSVYEQNTQPMDTPSTLPESAVVLPAIPASTFIPEAAAATTRDADTNSEVQERLDAAVETALLDRDVELLNKISKSEVHIRAPVKDDDAKSDVSNGSKYDDSEDRPPAAKRPADVQLTVDMTQCKRKSGRQPSQRQCETIEKAAAFDGLLLARSPTVADWRTCKRLQAFIAVQQGQVPLEGIDSWDAYDMYLIHLAYLSIPWITTHEMFVTSSWLATCFDLDAELRRDAKLLSLRAGQGNPGRGPLARYASERGLQLEDVTRDVTATILGIGVNLIGSGYTKTHPELRYFIATPDAIFNEPFTSCLGEWKNMTNFGRIAVMWCGHCPVGDMGAMKKNSRGVLERGSRKRQESQRNGVEPIAPASDIPPCADCIPCPRVSHVMQTLGALCVFDRTSDYLVYTIISDSVSAMSIDAAPVPAPLNVRPLRTGRNVYVAMFRVGFDSANDKATFWNTAKQQITQFCTQVYTPIQNQGPILMDRRNQGAPEYMLHPRRDISATGKAFMTGQRVLITAPSPPSNGELPNGNNGFLTANGMTKFAVIYRSPYLPGCVVRLVAYLPDYLMTDAQVRVAQNCIAVASAHTSHH